MMKTAVLGLMLILVTTSCAGVSPRDQCIGDRNQILGQLVDVSGEPGEAEDCKKCFDTWSETGLVDMAWSEVEKEHNLEHILCVWERGSPDSPYLPAYHLNILALTEAGYLLVESSVRAKDTLAVSAQVSVDSVTAINIAAAAIRRIEADSVQVLSGDAEPNHCCCSYFSVTHKGKQKVVVQHCSAFNDTVFGLFLDSLLSPVGMADSAISVPRE